MRPKKPSAIATAVATMPPLRHREPGQPFDPYQSDVLAWLRDNAGVQHQLFQLLRGRKAIVFDRNTRTWRGKDWRGGGR